MTPWSLDCYSEAMETRATGDLAFSERLGITRELVIALDVLTHSGQRHVMHRVVNILRSEIPQAALPFAAPERATVVAALTALEHEVARQSPILGDFKTHAGRIIDVLTKTRRG